jgi:hypothetical protein
VFKLLSQDTFIDAFPKKEVLERQHEIASLPLILYSLQGGQKEYFNSREKRYFEKLTRDILRN